MKNGFTQADWREQQERQRAQDDRAFEREKYGYYCSVCGSGEYDTLESLRQHIQSAHPEHWAIGRRR